MHALHLCPRTFILLQGTKVDVWASGVTLWNMLTGSYPFDGDSLFGLFNAIGLGKRLSMAMGLC